MAGSRSGLTPKFLKSYFVVFILFIGASFLNAQSWDLSKENIDEAIKIVTKKLEGERMMTTNDAIIAIIQNEIITLENVETSDCADLQVLQGKVNQYNRCLAILSEPADQAVVEKRNLI